MPLEGKILLLTTEIHQRIRRSKRRIKTSFDIYVFAHSRCNNISTKQQKERKKQNETKIEQEKK